MYEREKYLVSFLRGCASAADEGELGVEHGKLLVNGELMREAADEFEKLLPDKDGFKDSTDEYQFNLVRAELHTRQAHDVLYRSDAPKRSLWIKMTVGRAQSILMSLWTQELRRRKS
jgi:hypothetical protein